MRPRWGRSAPGRHRLRLPTIHNLISMELKFILEAILFAAQKPLSLKEIREIFVHTAENSSEPAAKPFKKVKEEELSSLLEQLLKEHESANRSFRLVCVAGAWQFVSQPE